MNTDWNDLIQRHMAGLTTEDETRRLEAAMKADDTLADLYLRHAELDVALEVQASTAEVTRGLLITSHEEDKRSSRWLSWRPLTAAAAAGIVIGLCSASLVFGFAGGFSGERLTRTDITLADADFDRADVKLEQGFPSGPQSWAVDEAEVSVVKGEGKALSLRSSQHPYSRAVQIVDVSHVGSGRGCSLELSARFMNADLAHACRYKLRLIGFAETADALQPFPLDTSDEGLVSSSQVLDVPVGAAGWHGVTTVMPLPPEVKTVVIWLGASTRPLPGPKASHWVDDVRLQRLSTTVDHHEPQAK